MKAIKIILLVSFLLGFRTYVFAGAETFSSPEWKTGIITGVTAKFIEIDGKLRLPDDPLVIKTLYGDELDSNLELLRGVEKIYFKEKNGKIAEIRIFGIAQ